MTHKLSICVCTYNRAASLRIMLESLLTQIGEAPYEVLVVDNNSNDETCETTSAFPGLAIRYMVERVQGLSHARNLALKEFQGDYLLFIDDDVRLAPGFLSAYRKAIETFHDADIFGGRILPDWGGPAPGWAGDRPLPLLDGLLVWLDLGDRARPFDRSEVGPFGASFAVSRRLAVRLGEFNPTLGCNGEKRGRGEEAEWFSRATRLGAQRVYVGDALCYHRVDQRRLRLGSLFEYGVLSGFAHREISRGDRRGSLMRLLGFGLRGVAQLLKGRSDRFRQCVINMGIEYDSIRR